MKTLREYIDQLDEISRRDFLKGAGATAGLAAMGAPKDAKAQIGAGENLAIDAASRVANYFKMLSQNTNPVLVRQIYNGVYEDVMSYQKQSNGRGIEQAVTTANSAIGQFLEKRFEMINNFLEKDKENDPTVPGYIARGLLGMQQPVTGMKKMDLSNTVREALGVYRQSLNQSLSILTAPQQLSKQDMDKLAAGLVLYLFAKEDNNTNIINQISQSLSKIIQTYKNKDQINQIYAGISQSHNQEKVKDPAATQRIKKSLYDASKRIISDLDSIGSRGGAEEFKEESVDEAATPDAVKRIEQLIQYK